MSQQLISEKRSDGFKPHYFANLFELESGHFWFQARNELIIWAIRKYFPNITALLEVGCGTGFVLSGIKTAFPSVALTGSEFFIEGIEFAKQRLPEANFIQMDARCIDPTEKFDVVGAFDVLEHIEEDELVLSNLRRITRRGLLLTLPQHQFLWSAVDDYACHKRRYSANELRTKLQAAGFRLIRITSFVSVLLPLLFLARMNKRTVDQFDPASELRIHPLVNSCLKGLLTVELMFIKAGVSLPFGGSLLAVAEPILD